MLITKTIASATLSLIVNGTPVQASFLHGSAPGCEMSAHTATQWRSAGAVVVEQRAGDWCTVGRVADGYWLAEQWQAKASVGNKSRGWLVRIPLKREQGWRDSSHSRQSTWPLDVFDNEISARIRYRQSFDLPDDHHQKSLRSAPPDALVLTRPHPDGGSYSVVIERGAKR